MISQVLATFNKWLRRSGFEIKKSCALPRSNWLGLRNIEFYSIFDVGANEGQFADEARRVFPAAHIYSFEPIAECFAFLQVKCQNAQKWHSFNVALSDSEKTAMFNLHENNMPSSSLLHATAEEVSLYPKSTRQRQVEVKCATLDKWCLAHPHALKTPAMLKLDVQGHELSVLEGGRSILNQIDAVICEVNVRALYEKQAGFPDVVNFLHTFGIHFHGILEHSYDDANNVIAFDAVFRRDGV